MISWMQQIRDSIVQQQVLPAGHRILIGVSGGPDSICLCHAMSWLAEDMEWTLAVAHLNHGMRGDASDADEALVASVCESLQLPYYSRRVDVPRIARRNGESLETCARLERLQFFRDLCEARKFDAVALAHNLDDHIETILFRLLRGTGLRGLVGIPKRRSLFRHMDACVVRPLLDVSREHIIKALKEQALDYRLDSSNYKSSYTRNRLRHSLLPMLQAQYNPNISGALQSLSAMAADGYEIITKAFDPDAVLTVEHGTVMVVTCQQQAVQDLSHFEILLLLEAAVELLTGEYSPMHKETMQQWSLLLQGEIGGAGFDLGGGISVWHEFDDIVIGRRAATPRPEDVLLAIPGTASFHEDRWRVSCETAAFDDKAYQAFRKSKTPLQEWLDADAVGQNLCVRAWQDGDVFQPLGMEGSKKLQDFFVDGKIPRRHRHSVPLLVVDDQIAWVVGQRIGHAFRIRPETRRVSKVTAWQTQGDPS